MKIKSLLKFAIIGMLSTTASYASYINANTMETLYDNHSYIQKNDSARSYWTLQPYYMILQKVNTGSSLKPNWTLSTPRATMVLQLNAMDAWWQNPKPVRGQNYRLTGSGQSNYMEQRLNDRVLYGKTSFTVNQYSNYMIKAMKYFDVQGNLKAYHVSNTKDGNGNLVDKTTFKNNLIAFANSYNDSNIDKNKIPKNPIFIAVNYLPYYITGQNSNTGKWATIAAYDLSKKDNEKSILIFDPDRTNSEPYWISVNNLYNAMCYTQNGNDSNRGYILISAKTNY